MSTVLLLRHGRTPANAAAILAGWTPGVELDEHGRRQAEAVAERLSVLPLRAMVVSPLERCRQTADLVAGRQAESDLKVHVEDRIGECHYGDWTGRPIKELAKEPGWQVVQQHPSAAVFPGEDGEALAATQARALTAIREWDARLTAEHGPDVLWLACSHGDVIKAILADALGMHLDLFQRISVEPCSVSAIRYTPTRPFVVKLNDTGGELASLIPPERPTMASESDAVLGGETGSGSSQ